MLDEEIFAVEFTAFYWLAAVLRGREGLRTALKFADPDGEVEVLGRDVPLPFIF
jgi:hypothetical protein